MDHHKHTNDLINETSPYLLQHAHNPVNWCAWSDDVLAVAKKENKLLIISIGYSSCHWCHVMEHESFEDESVAQVMNENYINIKVDREERPDVDAVYMNALQLMSGRGGWPLNIVALPDGRPVWGATYLPKENWVDALQQIATLKTTKPDQLTNYASRLDEGLKQMSLVAINEDKVDINTAMIDSAVAKWSQQFDFRLGGMRRAPKFMMPNNYEFLLRYGIQQENDDVLRFVKTTLELMAYGGVYDQIGGGFSRYSVDEKWHVPHFEKMLYDNAQLLSLYSKTYKAEPAELYKETVYQTIDFIKREMLDSCGGFYSALDADSLNSKNKLEEGAYYVWKKDELKQILDQDFELFAAYYNINDYGYWEHGNYVLIRQDSDADFIEEHGLNAADFTSKKSKWHSDLLAVRDKRARPRLDDKILTSWNGHMITGLVNAFEAFGESQFLQLAENTGNFILEKALRSDRGLNRTFKNGTSSINAYLEDYAAVIEGFLKLFDATGEQSWLDHANQLTDHVIAHFAHEKNNMFYFTSSKDTALITRNIEYLDNVIPASNSIMAKNLFKLGHLTGNKNHPDRAAAMLNDLNSEITTYASSYSNWLDLAMSFTNPFFEVVITGPDAKEYYRELAQKYIPQAVFALSEKENDNLSIFKNRFSNEETKIFVCQDNTCKLPVKSVAEALELL